MLIAGLAMPTHRSWATSSRPATQVPISARDTPCWRMNATIAIEGNRGDAFGCVQQPKGDEAPVPAVGEVARIQRCGIAILPLHAPPMAGHSH
jgi:hypothetical protein